MSHTPTQIQNSSFGIDSVVPSLQGSATYSPDDNKLRLYPVSRLDTETYNRVKAAGFKWAPKQELFVAPAWSPSREDLLIELCGEIDDDDTSLIERAEERAIRFDDYSDKRAQDSARASAAVSAIADNIPFGQPILIGHHSEKRARKDAERIENGMRRAVKMWEQSEYWTRRAAGALAHAKYKERPDVRARRIKGIEADKRKAEKNKAEAEKFLKAWSTPNLTLEQARHIANYCWLHLPRKEGDKPDFNQTPTVYDALNNSYPTLYAPRTLEEVITTALQTYPRHIAHYNRWIAHYDNRLAYERAMLAESGGTVADRTGPEVGGAVKCLWSPRGGWAYIQKVNKVTITILHCWNEGGRVFKHNEPLDKLNAIMTKAQVEEKRAAGLLQETSDGRGFYLLEAPEPKPETQEPKPENTNAQQIETMRETLKAGVQIVTAHQLFPTPRELAERVADIAGVLPGHRVLEPSAGTGNLIGALGGRMFGHNPESGAVHAIEINQQLASRLQAEFPLTEVHCNDFLENVPDDFEPFDRIVMNPPFENGADIRHIIHAAKFLKPGGLLVAICANGPRQNAALRPIADTWEELPPDSFKSQGTSVNTALLTIRGQA